MGAREQLRVRVDDELGLDAGTCEEVSGPHGPEHLIRPPASTLFHQVLAYLQAKPDPLKRPSGSMVGREGVAAAALSVRWGSYLAVLLDHNKPVWPEVHSERVSRISDEEMARINIEASAALAEWIELRREDEQRYRQLMNRAAAYLPMPTRMSEAKVSAFAALEDAEMVTGLVQTINPEQLERARADAVNARRMGEVAAHLVHQMFPPLPVRQWVLSVPKRLRDFQQRHPEALSAVRHLLLRVIEARLRQGSRCAGARPGVVSFVQRFGASLNAHVHFHCCIIDGVFGGGTAAASTVQLGTGRVGSARRVGVFTGVGCRLGRHGQTQVLGIVHGDREDKVLRVNSDDEYRPCYDVLSRHNAVYVLDMRQFLLCNKAYILGVLPWTQSLTRPHAQTLPAPWTECATTTRP